MGVVFLFVSISLVNRGFLWAITFEGHAQHLWVPPLPSNSALPLTFCCAIHPVASWKLLGASSPQPPELPRRLLLRGTVLVKAIWSPLSWSRYTSKLQVTCETRWCPWATSRWGDKMNRTWMLLHLLTTPSLGWPMWLISMAQFIILSMASRAFPIQNSASPWALP